MAKDPDDDRRVTDLRAYRKARQQEKRRRAPRPPAPRPSFLGSNPRAGLILAIVVAVLAALYIIPRVL